MSAVKVVLDTNLLVSYLLTQGETISRLIEYWEQGRIVVLMSPSMLEELANVVTRPRLRRHMAVDPQVLIDLLTAEALPVAGELIVSGACRDPKDDKFLACAVEGKADYIVTGDADLFDLQSFRDIPIVRSFELLLLMDEAQP
ncbi:putative toxin-antitoxin system toxin component, PIN family [Promineifilum sp.]|uniref:putative toxin-antitoxin system toxin component, PIN family n=1 Tax=Promineifilum sp. TaxID=2664178 RepID=UPI0035B33209